MQVLKQDELQGLLTTLASLDEYVFLDTARCDEENHRSLLFVEPLQRLECFPGDDPEAFLLLMQGVLDQGHYLAGWIGYEFGYLPTAPSGKAECSPGFVRSFCRAVAL